MMTWRDRARPIIAAVILETQGQDEKAINQALRDAYPFGPMSHHPYKIWRDEVRLQLGLRKPKQRVGFNRKPEPPDPRQLSLI